jgi:hypothetical protein
MTEEEEIRVGRLEGEVDILRQRLDDLINGMVDTIKNHPIWKHNEMSDVKNEREDKMKSVESVESMESMESMEGASQVFGPEKISKFLKLCDDLRCCVLEVLDSLDQTEDVVHLRNRLKNATIWNEIFDLSILGIGEQLRQLKEKETIKRGKEH